MTAGKYRIIIPQIHGKNQVVDCYSFQEKATTYTNFFLARPSSGCFLTYCAVKSTLTLGGFLQQRLDKVLPGVVASEGQTKNAVLLEGSDVKSPPA